MMTNKYQRLPFKLVAAYQNGGIHSGCGQLCYAHLQSEFLRSISTEEFFMYYVPIEMTKEYVSSNEIYDKVNGERIRITADIIKVIVLQGKLTEVYFAEVESEEMYHELMRPIWREEKALQRNKKCAVRNKNGKLIRCDGNCSTCSHSQSGSQISLETMEETGGFRSIKDGVHRHIDPATYSKSTEDIVMDAVLLEELFMQISMLSEENQKIITMFREGASERDIAKAVGLSQKGVNKRKKAIFDDLRKKLKNFF
jgi:hypothetical protein